MTFFQKRPPFMLVKDKLSRKLEVLAKCVVMLLIPIPFAAIIGVLWYFAFYKQGLHFHPDLEGIATAAWIPTFGILYGLLAAIVLQTVWNEYKAMRVAIKRYDIHAFMELRDEEISPLIHTMMLVLSASVLAAFMGLAYPDPVSGILLTSSTAYLFTTFFNVVREIDDPFSGLWFIKNVPEGWLEVDAKKWRHHHSKDKKADFDRWRVEHKND